MARRCVFFLSLGLLAVLGSTACTSGTRWEEPLHKGMTAEEVRGALGRPSEIILTESSLGLRAKRYLYDRGSLQQNFEVILIADRVFAFGPTDSRTESETFAPIP